MEILLKIIAIIALIKGIFMLRFLYENYISPRTKRETKVVTPEESEHFREIMERFHENFQKKFPIRLLFGTILFLGGFIFLVFF